MLLDYFLTPCGRLAGNEGVPSVIPPKSSQTLSTALFTHIVMLLLSVMTRFYQGFNHCSIHCMICPLWEDVRDDVCIWFGHSIVSRFCMNDIFRIFQVRLKTAFRCPTETIHSVDTSLQEIVRDVGHADTPENNLDFQISDIKWFSNTTLSLFVSTLQCPGKHKHII